MKGCSARLSLSSPQGDQVQTIEILRPAFWEGNSIHLKTKGMAKEGELPALELVVKKDAGLKEFKDLLPHLRKHYKETTPVAIIYNAGMSGRQHQVTGTLQDILSKTTREQEDFLGLIYVGPCLVQKAGDCH